MGLETWKSPLKSKLWVGKSVDLEFRIQYGCPVYRRWGDGWFRASPSRLSEPRLVFYPKGPSWENTQWLKIILFLIEAEAGDETGGKEEDSAHRATGETAAC